MTDGKVLGTSGEVYRFRNYELKEDNINLPIGVYLIGRRINDPKYHQSYYYAEHLQGITQPGKSYIDMLNTGPVCLLFECDDYEVEGIIKDLHYQGPFKIYDF